ncbi:MAG TPA: PhnD/SsuA/transferrin family substrate-binding protein [Chloroflexota bacterium]|jgi:4,5-dihydroxyphthalate decarboxylase
MANNLHLSFIMSPNERSQPILDGSVQPEGIDLTTTSSSPGEIFWRQLHAAEFDISEMSVSSLLIVTAKGNSPWVAIPVFPIRRLFHTEIFVGADSGIERPEDLKGKRVGVPEYQQTAALWTRGALQHEFGVRPEDLHWHMERTPQTSHGGATGFQPPPGVDFQYIPLAKNIGAMIVSGELDATAFYSSGGGSMVDRSTIDLARHPRARRLFPDPEAEGVRYYEKTGIAPINHTVVIRREIVDKHPWVAVNVYQAFVEAKEQMLKRARALADPFIRLGMLPPETRKRMASDPYPYGLQANRKVLETAAEYSHEQGLTPRRVSLEEVFAPSTLAL